MKILKIVVIFGAGGQKRLYFAGIPLPGMLAWPWPGLKKILNKIGVKVKFLNKLKPETLAILNTAFDIERAENPDFILVFDSYSPGRKKQEGTKQVGEMMKELLVKKSVSSGRIVVSGSAVQTRGKAGDLIDYLNYLKDSFDRVSFHILLPVARYYKKRAVQGIEMRVEGLPIRITTFEVNIPWYCWFSEYLFNRISEPWKRKKSEKELDEYEKAERKAREEYKIKE